MNYGKLKAALMRLINRKDLTDALAGDFVNRAISECQREIRLAPSESLLIADGWDGTNNAITIPGDYLELTDIFTDDGVLVSVDRDRYFRTCQTGDPSVYTKAGSAWLIRPAPAPGARIYVQYFRQQPQLIDDADSNFWTEGAFNAVAYTAAAFAADEFQMEDSYVARFQGRADRLMQAILAQDYDDRWSGTHTVGRPSDTGDY